MMSPPRLTAFVWIKRAALAGLLLLLISAASVGAHGFIVRAIPENRAVLERAPARVQYWFSEGLERAFSSVTVRDQTGTVIATGGVDDQNNALMTARLPANLPDGAYVAELRVAFASDGHVITETRVFFVGAAVESVTSSTTVRAEPLEVIWRAVSLAAILLLLGIYAVYALALVPAWGSPQHPAGLLPPRVMRRLSAAALAALGAAFAAQALAIVQQGMALFNADLGTTLAQGYWNIARIGTRFGDLWTARLLLLILAAALHGLSLYVWRAQPALVRPFWVANAWALALVVGTFSAGSHAAGSLLWPWVGIFVDWAHALAVGLWAGGLGALALALPVALAPYTGEARRLALLAALNRFSRLAAACLGVVIATGVYSALNWIATPADLTSTAFGGALGLKLLLAAGLVAVGAAHHIALRPERYQRWAAVARRVGSFLPTLRLEAVLAAAVVAAAGLLSATPVPVPETTDQPPLQAQAAVEDYQVALVISPGGPGVNTFDITLTRGGRPASGQEVRLRAVQPARDWRGPWETAEEAGDGLYIAASADIDRPGAWWALVDVIVPGEPPRRAAFAWDIRAEAAVLQSRPPTLLNALALLVALAAVGWAFYPLARRVYRRLDLRPAVVTVALGVIFMTALFSIIGVVVVQNAQAQYEATVNPPPKRINPTLPDAASLARGAALYARACPWDSLADHRALVERLPRTRDEELFAAVSDGWRGLPACAAPLDEGERWDIVNFLRTKEAAGS